MADKRIMRKNRYYLENENYNLLKTLKNSLYGKKIKEFPESISVETISGCNAKCVFCGQLQRRKGLPHGRMSSEIFKKIVDECAQNNALLKRFSFAFDNEPLLDKNLINKVSYVKAKCPAVITNITTNGILLTKDIIKIFYEKAVVDEINISIQSIDRATYEKLTGVKAYDKVMANMDDLSIIHKSHLGKKPVIEINTCLTPDTIREKEVMIEYWHEKGFKSHYIKLDNRNLNDLKYNEPTNRPIRYYEYCRRPFHTMIICWDGMVPICCADYQRSCVLGDITANSVYEIWNGQRMYQARKELISGKFNSAKICASCLIAA